MDSAQLDDPLYLQGQLWGPHHLSLGVWGRGGQPAHQLVVRQAGQRLQLIRSFVFFFFFFFLGYMEDVHSMQAARPTKIPDEPMLCETPALSR